MDYVNVIWNGGRERYGVVDDCSDAASTAWFTTHAAARATAARRADERRSYVVDGSPRGIRAIEALYRT